MCSCDSLKADYRWNLFEHLNHFQPSALTISTPCNGRKGFNALNRAVNSDGWRLSRQRVRPASGSSARDRSGRTHFWRLSRRTSLALNETATETTRLQLEERRHLVIRQPLNSDVFQTKDWEKLEGDQQIFQVTINQDMAGKRGKHTLMLTKRPINFRSSRHQLLEGLRKFKCNGKHELASRENSCSSSRTDAKHVKTAENAGRAPDIYHTLGTAISDYPRQNRPNRQCNAANIREFGAFKHTLLKERQSHACLEGECRLPTEVPTDLTCPVCFTDNRPNEHSSHTKAAGECKTAPMTAYPPRERCSATRGHGYKPDTPVPVAHEDSSRKLTPIAPAPDTTEAELTPPTETPVEELPIDNGDTATTSSSGARPTTRMPASDERRPKTSSISQTWTHDVEQEWTAFDVGHVIKPLHLPVLEIVLRTLRRLHVRLPHATAQLMLELYAHAGTPKLALDMVKPVVETCRVRRCWTCPNARASDNHQLYNRLLVTTISCIIEVSRFVTRWSAGGILENNEAITICRLLLWRWVKPYGPRYLLVTDSESGSYSEEMGTFRSRHGIQAKPKPTEAHANIVERNHEMLRQFVHQAETPLRGEKIKMPLAFITTERFAISNIMISVVGFTPYQAAVGRMPTLMSELEPNSECQLDDASAGIPGTSRFYRRSRGIVARAMTELTAQQRLNQALKSHTRRPAKTLQLQDGDEVDFYRPPVTKDESDWRGPATVAKTGLPVVINWQNRRTAYHTQDVRRALVYLVCPMTNLSNAHVMTENTDGTYLVQSDDSLEIAQSFVDELQRQMIRV